MLKGSLELVIVDKPRDNLFKCIVCVKLKWHAWLVESCTTNKCMLSILENLGYDEREVGEHLYGNQKWIHFSNWATQWNWMSIASTQLLLGNVANK